MKTLDLILIILGSFLFIFIVTMIVIYCIKDWNMDQLITMVLSGCGIETIMTGIITVSKFKRKTTDEEETDDNF